jgi:heme/copper-type cytochrome/quinol oxidase subunit 2
MPRKARRIFAGIAWVVGSLIAWWVVCIVFGLFVFMYLGNERQVKLPEWSNTLFEWTGTAGVFLIPAFVAVLAMRAYLPGTGPRPSKLRGFAVEAVKRNG